MKNLSNDVVIHKNKDGFEYLQFKKLLEYPNIEHCYTMSCGGIDFNIYEDDYILQKTYDKVCSIFELNKENIVKPHQSHTDNIKIIKNLEKNLYDIDGMLTDLKDIILCSTSADCTSLILFDPKKNVIGNVHSGWRGTIKRIGQKTVQKMINEYGCDAKDIICCICPHIRKCHFEVGEEVAKIFINNFKDIEDIDKLIVKKSIDKISNNEQKYYIDTTMINVKLLQKIGLKDKNILDSGICNVCNKEYFHSYRVEKQNYGKNAAIIVRR